MIGTFGQSTFVQPHEGVTLMMFSGRLPVLVNSKTYIATGPRFSTPKSWVSPPSNLNIGPSLGAGVPCAFACIEVPNRRKNNGMNNFLISFYLVLFFKSTNYSSF